MKTRVLYDVVEKTIRPYTSREDDEAVVGLDESQVLVLDVVEEPQPTVGAGEFLRPLQTPNLETRQLVNHWEVVTMPRRWASAEAFMAAFTHDEMADIALSTNRQVAGMRFKLATWRSAMEPDHAEVVGGLDLLEAVGILAAGRKEEILATAPYGM